MNTKIVHILSFLIFFSCSQKEIPYYDKLTDAERAAIRAMSYNSCKEKYQPFFNNFKTTSLAAFDSTAYNRNQGFYYEYKLGADVKRKMDIRIWKRDGDADVIYFYITETVLNPVSYFLRVTRVTNEEMIDDLLEDHCMKDSTVTTDNDGPINIVNEYIISNAPNMDNYKDSYEMAFNSLAMFANFKLNRTITAKKDTTVVTTTNYVSSLAAKTFALDDTLPSTNAAYVQRFCDMAYETGSIFRLSKTGDILGYKTTCSDTMPGSWNLVF